MHAHLYSESLKGRDRLRDLEVDGRVLLKRILHREWYCGLASSGLRQTPVARACEHGNDPLYSINVGKVLDQMSDHHILVKNSVAWN